nr:hypothetical protein [Propionibacterium sp.]
MTPRLATPASGRLILARHRVEITGRLPLLVAALPVLLALMSLVGYRGMADEVAQGTAKAAAWTPELRSFLVDLNPATFAAIAATDSLYKAYFSFALILVGLVAWRVVGVTQADGVHAYYLLGGRTRADIAVNTLGVLAVLVAELVALTLAANMLVGLAGFGGTLTEVTVAQLAGVVALHGAALVPLLNYAVLIALAARLHAPRVPLLVVAVSLPIAIGLVDTITPTKHGSPWGTLAFFTSVPALDAAFVTALAVEVGWLALLVALFWVASAREEVLR